MQKKQSLSFERPERKEPGHPEVKILKAIPVPDNIPGMAWVERVARWLDSRFTIPGTNIRFGIDPLMSLFPVLGDLLTYFISGMLIYTMYNRGASSKLVVKMILNSSLDAVIGAIPLVGTVFDVFFRANDRNVRLLKEHYFEGKHQGSGKGILAVVVLASIVVVVAASYGMYKLLEAIF